MIRINSLSIRRGPRLLFDESTLSIHPGQKVGITGGNGTGKSSLFALIMGEMHLDEGELSIPDSWVISHVAQEVSSLECSAIDLVMDGDRELRKLEQRLAVAIESEDGLLQGEIYADIESIDGFNARNRAARLMQGLGFSVEQEDSLVESFSGGWRVRLNLAQALMARSDLLLLDEPTNHLDLDAVFWLEEWLKQYRGTLLVISHDRDLLDRVVDGVVNIEHKKMELTSGNYSSFERVRIEKLSQQQSAFERQQREQEHMHKFVSRFRATASKAKQVQSRVKALEKMEAIAPAHVDSPFNFHFFEPKKLPHPMLTIEHADAGYGDLLVLEDYSITLNPGDRMALLGRNGAGKSTLMKLMASSSTMLSGSRNEAKDLKIGYFAQHQLELLDMDATPLLHLQRQHPDATEQQLRTYLGSFGFQKDRVLEPVGPFSGGEKARLVLALIIRQNPNLLLLDEPTNHLDLEMRHALVMALQEFEGALVVVSHDRYLLEGVADSFLLVAGGTVTPFSGDLDEYAAWLRSESKRIKPNSKNETKTKSKGKSKSKAKSDDGNIGSKKLKPDLNKKERAEERKKLAPVRKKIKSCEQKIEKLEVKSCDIEDLLSSAEIYEESSKVELKELLQQKNMVDTELKQLEEALLEYYELTE